MMLGLLFSTLEIAVRLLPLASSWIIRKAGIRRRQQHFSPEAASSLIAETEEEWAEAHTRYLWMGVSEPRNPLSCLSLEPTFNHYEFAKIQHRFSMHRTSYDRQQGMQL
jgi:hypothetical protein